MKQRKTKRHQKASGPDEFALQGFMKVYDAGLQTEIAILDIAIRNYDHRWANMNSSRQINWLNMFLTIRKRKEVVEGDNMKK